MKYVKCSSIRTPHTAAEVLMVPSKSEPSRVPSLVVSELCPGRPLPPGTGTMACSATESGDLQSKTHKVSFGRDTYRSGKRLKRRWLTDLCKCVQVCVSSVKTCRRRSADRSSSQGQAWSVLPSLVASCIGGGHGVALDLDHLFKINACVRFVDYSWFSGWIQKAVTFAAASLWQTVIRHTHTRTQKWPQYGCSLPPAGHTCTFTSRDLEHL